MARRRDNCRYDDCLANIAEFDTAMCENEKAPLFSELIVLLSLLCTELSDDIELMHNTSMLFHKLMEHVQSREIRIELLHLQSIR